MPWATQKCRNFCDGIGRFYALSRCACFGVQVLRLLGWKKIVLNHSKSRVDYLIELRKKPEIKPHPQIVGKHLLRKDVLGAIEQQQYDFFSYKKPDVIFMDSFAELTDQLFMHKDCWQFLSHYSDINHSELFEKSFTCKGLLNPADIATSYEAFFDMLQKVYPAVPIIFLHFPTVLDSREKFKERGKIIFEALQSIKCRFANLHVFHVPEDIVGWPGECKEEMLKDFPYHYSENVYDNQVEQILALGIRYPWHCRFIDKITKRKPRYKTLNETDYNRDEV